MVSKVGAVRDESGGVPTEDKGTSSIVGDGVFWERRINRSRLESSDLGVGKKGQGKTDQIRVGHEGVRKKKGPKKNDRKIASQRAL